MTPETIRRLPSFFRRHRVETLLFFVFWASFAYFYHIRSGWNENTRLGLTLAIVDRGTVNIDAYHDRAVTSTGDKAFYGGHFYCDKSPALSFLAVPFYAAIKPFQSSSNTEIWVPFARRWCIAWTVGLLGALAGASFYRLMRLFGGRPEEALALTVFLVWGTNLGGYTSVFYPYTSATACLVAAYVLLMGPRSSGGNCSRTRAAAIGFLISMAGFFELFFGLAGLAMLALTLWTMRPKTRFIWTLLAAAIPVIALAVYCHSLFNAFELPYKHEWDKGFQQGMAQGFMGISRFKAAVLYFITVHPYKGLFFYSPVLLLFFLGSLWVASRLGKKFAPDLVMSWAIVVGYLAFNSSYYMWWGGQSMGARHLIPMLPFMFLPILAAMRRESRMRGVVMLAGAISVMMNVPAIAVGPEMKTYCDVASLLNPDISWNLTSAWLVDVFPSFWRGDIAVTPFGFLPGILPIAPLALLWAASLWQAWRWGIEDAGEAASV